MTPFLSRRLYLKGGVLMGLVYDSPRQTSDIDFSTSPDYLPDNQTTDELRDYLDGSLPRAAATLGYIDTVLRVQSINEQPHKWHPGISFSFPALEVKIGYAIWGTPQEKQLERKEASNVVPLDINFNEKTSGVQTLEFAENKSLLDYSLNDLIAEKYRAILEQVERNRERRQDVFDLDILIRKPGLKPAEIVNSLISKCEFRGISPKFDSITNPEIKNGPVRNGTHLSLKLRNCRTSRPASVGWLIFIIDYPGPLLRVLFSATFLLAVRALLPNFKMWHARRDSNPRQPGSKPGTLIQLSYGRVSDLCDLASS